MVIRKGGMGPDLTDGHWRYGGTPVQIFKSIYEGRPAGHAGVGRALPQRSIWQLRATSSPLAAASRRRSITRDSRAIRRQGRQAIEQEPGSQRRWRRQRRRRQRTTTSRGRRSGSGGNATDEGQALHDPCVSCRPHRLLFDCPLSYLIPMHRSAGGLRSSAGGCSPSRSWWWSSFPVGRWRAAAADRRRRRCAVSRSSATAAACSGSISASAISSVVLAASVVWTLLTLKAVAQPSEPQRRSPSAIDARQWWWQADYRPGDPNAIFTTANEIHIPVGVPVRARASSADVIHCFWVPQARRQDRRHPRPTQLDVARGRQARRLSRPVRRILRRRARARWRRGRRRCRRRATRHWAGASAAGRPRRRRARRRRARRSSMRIAAPATRCAAPRPAASSAPTSPPR